MAGGPLRRAVNADSVSIHSFEHIQPRCICFIPAAQIHLTSQGLHGSCWVWIRAPEEHLSLWLYHLSLLQDSWVGKAYGALIPQA